jgi:hypothetical protein
MEAQANGCGHSATVDHLSRSSVFSVKVVWSKNSCSLTLVVFQEASEPFTTLHGALTLAASAG